MSKYEFRDAFLSGIRYTESKGIEVLFSIPYQSGNYFNTIQHDPAIISGIAYQLKVPIIDDKEYQAFVMWSRFKNTLPNPPVYRLTYDHKLTEPGRRPHIKFLGYKMYKGFIFELTKATWGKVAYKITPEEAKSYINMYFSDVIVYSDASGKGDPNLIPRGYVPLYQVPKLAKEFEKEKDKFMLAYKTIKVAVPSGDTDLTQEETDSITEVLDNQREEISNITKSTICPYLSDSTSHTILNNPNGVEVFAY